MTLPLPTHDGENTQAIFDLIAQSAIDTGGRSIKLRWGHASSTYPGGANSFTTTAAHGMGSAPTAVIPVFDSVGPWGAPLITSAFTATTFTWGMRTVDGSLPAAATATGIYWLAIG